tara:strand:- start:122 stop:289 length:168 start_codon:yes stop_codon:yes gene_type:complete
VGHRDQLVPKVQQVLPVLKGNRVLKAKGAPVGHREFRELKGTPAYRVSLFQKQNF